MDDDNNLAIHYTIHNGYKNRKLPNETRGSA
jgi:hypothetical protein